MRFLLSLLFVLSLSCLAHSQAAVSGDLGVIYMNKNTNTNRSLEGKRGGLYGAHQLGDTIRLAFDKFLKYYVKYESEGGAYAVEKKVYAKKEIYNSVLKLDKFFKKEVRTNRLTKLEAVTRMGVILNSAINVRFLETTELERLLSVSKDLERKEYIFNNIKFRE